jgi:SAM-dependent methyltransferase
MSELQNESNEVVKRYASRTASIKDDRYSMLNPAVWQGVQERQRALLKLLVEHRSKPIADMQLLEVGCGSGGNLLELLRMGFQPSNLVGNELLPERSTAARLNLPLSTQVFEGDAMQLPFDPSSFDVVYQSTVFTSLLDENFQQQLANKMWTWVKPGGAVLWYDFTYDNPNNPDVRGVPLSRLRHLFPHGTVHSKRVTLAPPLSRRVCKLHPALYTVLNSLPLLRTHLLCWIEKK